MKLRYLFLVGVCLAFASTAQAQFKKLLQKAEQKADQAVDKKLGINQKNTSTGNNAGTTGTNGGPGSSGSSSSGGSNQGGAGLITTPPDVKQNLDDAEASFKKTSYSDARYSIQQAMLGVELEIGNQILKSFPPSVSGLNPDTKQDQVASSGSGWAGLMIHREYNGGSSSKENRQFEVTVANNSAWMSALNIYFNNAGFAQQQTGGQQNWKQTKFKGYRAIIEYSDGSGYKLSVPIGQSTLIVFEGRSFKTEPDMMSACETVDVEGIKKMLGEQ